MIRDYQRKKVYAAEAEFRSSWKGTHFKTLHELRDYVKSVTTSPWWQSVSTTRDIRVLDGRGRRKACAWWDPKTSHLDEDCRYTIAMPKWARCEQITLHELAHILSVTERDSPTLIVSPHGRNFCRANMQLVEVSAGRGVRRKLRSLYIKHRVAIFGTDYEWFEENEKRKSKRADRRIGGHLVGA
jgi:putative metallohydrolase (TIGR04338 family)